MIAEQPYAAYWNDAVIEQQKGAFCSTDDGSAMEKYAKQSGLVSDFEFCTDTMLKKSMKVAGVGLDIASGALWLLPHIFRLIDVSRITCIEYSRHRLLEIGPSVVAHYGLPADKITLALGSFYDIRTAPAEADFAVLCQAFHHADDPDALLQQLHKALRPGGVVIVLGEHQTNWTLKNDLLHPLYYLASKIFPWALHQYSGTGRPRSFIARSQDIFPPDPLLGDHYYFPRDYRAFFSRHGFSLEIIPIPNSVHLAMVATKIVTTSEP